MITTCKNDGRALQVHRSLLPDHKKRRKTSKIAITKKKITLPGPPFHHCYQLSNWLIKRFSMTSNRLWSCLCLPKIESSKQVILCVHVFVLCTQNCTYWSKHLIATGLNLPDDVDGLKVHMNWKKLRNCCFWRICLLYK